MTHSTIETPGALDVHKTTCRSQEEVIYRGLFLQLARRYLPGWVAIVTMPDCPTDRSSDGNGKRKRMAKRLWTRSSIKQRHELPDAITRKDGYGNVAVTPRPATSCDSAD